MNDLNCDSPIPEQPVSDEVSICTSIEEAAEAEELVTAPAPQPKKGRLWPPLLILGVMFALGLFLFFFLGHSSPAETDPSMPWFTVQDGTLYFDKSLYAGSSELTVPSAINGQAVTAISDYCFAQCQWLTTVHLPEGIQTIGSGAFDRCVSLRGIKLPETAETLGDSVFSGCRSLEAVCIPYSVTEIGSHPFEGCARLSYVFYTGPMASWESLGVEISDSRPEIYCYDGIYPQR